jgi:hypothetical protein
VVGWGPGEARTGRDEASRLPDTRAHGSPRHARGAANPTTSRRLEPFRNVASSHGLKYNRFRQPDEPFNLTNSTNARASAVDMKKIVMFYCFERSTKTHAATGAMKLRLSSQSALTITSVTSSREGRQH